MGDFHHEITDPADLHEEKHARDAALGTVLRFNGAGQGAPVLDHIGFAVATVSGSSISLTEAQAAAAVLTVDGNLVAATDVIVPDGWGPVVVRNAAVGDFSLTVKTAAGSGIVVGPGEAPWLAVVSGAVVRLQARVKQAAAGVAVAGVTTTLTQAQAEAEVIVVAGALTANSEIIVPSWWGPAFVRNATTGAFTLTIKTSAGAGVVVGAGKSVALTLIAGDTVALTAEV